MMQDAYVDNDSQQSSCMSQAPVYQQELIYYLAHASAGLRPHTNIHTFLRHLVVITQNIPGFYHCALYLYEQQHFYRVHLSPSDPEQIAYFREYPLSEALVDALMSDEYRVGQAYIIPVNSEGYHLEAMRQLFASFEPTNILPVGSYIGQYVVQPSTSAKDVTVIPLYSNTSILLGFLLARPYPQRVDTIQEILPLLGLFTDQIATLLERMRLHEEIGNCA